LQLIGTSPLTQEALEELEYFTGCAIGLVLGNAEEINQILDMHYGIQTSIKNLVEGLEQTELTPLRFSDFENGIFSLEHGSGPVHQVLYLIFSQALQDRASDIHFEPTERDLQVRFRVDGVLHSLFHFSKQISPALVSSIKLLAKLDIAEKRRPLDGSFQLKIDRRMVDVRVSTFPVFDGEKVVVRLLDKAGASLSLLDLGLSGDPLHQVKNLIKKPYGIFLVTGPTGSGKTTTLYAILNELKSSEKNIMTIEDPIEYHLEQVNQSQVNEKAGLTFSTGLRSFLRQDPDVMLVGEIRDTETAEISFQAALTGHMVLSTLHTNDATSSLVRLADMKVEPFLLSSSLVGVLAQRLVRKLCPYCLTDYEPASEVLEWAKANGWDLQQKSYIKGAGCSHCKNQGYKGRIGIFELMIPDENLKQMILRGEIANGSIREYCLKQGMKTLRQDGFEKVAAQYTTLEEIMRVAR
jgi:type IV pilus assembly protein PilB